MSTKQHRLGCLKIEKRLSLGLSHSPESSEESVQVWAASWNKWTHTNTHTHTCMAAYMHTRVYRHTHSLSLTLSLYNTNTLTRKTFSALAVYSGGTSVTQIESCTHTHTNSRLKLSYTREDLPKCLTATNFIGCSPLSSHRCRSVVIFRVG